MTFGPYNTHMLLGFSSDASTNYPGFNVTYMTGKWQLTEILLTWCNHKKFVFTEILIAI